MLFRHSPSRRQDLHAVSDIRTTFHISEFSNRFAYVPRTLNDEEVLLMSNTNATAGAPEYVMIHPDLDKLGVPPDMPFSDHPRRSLDAPVLAT